MTSNPMLRPSVMENIMLDSKPMTVQGAINKTIILTAIVAICAYYTWHLCATGFTDKAYILTGAGATIALIIAIVTTFNPKISNITAPIFAILEGLVVGSVSYNYIQFYEGIIAHALIITLLALLSMLLLYKSGAIKATPTFTKVVVTSTFAIFIFYIAGVIGALFGHPMTIFNGSIIGICVSIVFCAVASLNFILDFNFIETAANRNAPDYFEWYGAFGLLTTVVWLYFEALRLLAQLSQRD